MAKEKLDKVYVIRDTPYACRVVAVGNNKKEAEAAYKLPDRFQGEQRLIYVSKPSDLSVLGQYSLVRLHNQMADRDSFSPMFTTEELGRECCWLHIKALSQVETKHLNTNIPFFEMCEDLGIKPSSFQLTGLHDGDNLLLTGVSVETGDDVIMPIKFSTKEKKMAEKKTTPAKGRAKKDAAPKAAKAADPTITRVNADAKFREGSLRGTVFKLIGAKAKMSTVVAKAEKEGITEANVIGAVNFMKAKGYVEVN